MTDMFTDFNHIKAQLIDSFCTGNLIKYSIKNKLPVGRHHYILICSFSPIQQQVAFQCFFQQEIWDLKIKQSNKYIINLRPISVCIAHVILNEVYIVQLHFLRRNFNIFLLLGSM